MYRQYEDPYKLEKELEDWLEQHPDESLPPCVNG